MKKTLGSLVLGMVIGAGGMFLHAQPERAMHPRIAAAIEHLRDAVDYMERAPHDFGGHRVDAIRACREAMRQLDFAMRYRGREDRERR